MVMEVLEIVVDVFIDDVIIYEGVFVLILVNCMLTMLKKK